MSAIIFIIVLAILILFHEFGHFLFAKLSKMRVDEFGIGFPPKLVSKQFGETKYSINLIPFGGFVKILGENADEGQGDARSFTSKKWYLQVLVLAGGVLFNLLLAFALFATGFMVGMPTSSGSPLIEKSNSVNFTIVSVSPNSPAENVGLKAGDKILYVESNGVELQGVELNPDSFREVVVNGQGEEVAIMYAREGESENKLVVMNPSFDLVPGSPAVGISTDRIGIVKLGLLGSLKEGLFMTFSVFAAVISGLFGLIANAFRGAADLSQITGPVGIIGFIGEASTLGVAYLLSFVAFISVNLAVINLIPFPALDGGRILFVLIEKIQGRPIRTTVANALNIAGFLILMGLMIVVTYNDIVRLIS